jgi:hypothetical protein
MFIAINTNMIQSFPIEFAGVGGSVAQITFQIGGVIGVAVQSGLDSTGTGLADWKGTQAGFWFSGALTLAAGIMFGKSTVDVAIESNPRLTPFPSSTQVSSTVTKWTGQSWRRRVKFITESWQLKSWEFEKGGKKI